MRFWLCGISQFATVQIKFVPTVLMRTIRHSPVTGPQWVLASLKIGMFQIHDIKNLTLYEGFDHGSRYRLETFFAEEDNHTQAPRWASNHVPD